MITLTVSIRNNDILGFLNFLCLLQILQLIFIILTYLDSIENISILFSHSFYIHLEKPNFYTLINFCLLRLNQ